MRCFQRRASASCFQSHKLAVQNLPAVKFKLATASHPGAQHSNYTEPHLAGWSATFPSENTAPDPRAFRSPFSPEVISVAGSEVPAMGC